MAMEAYSEDFLKWWQIYPRKAAKRKSYLLWKDAVNFIAEERQISKADAKAWLLEVTWKFSESDLGKNGNYCPHPKTWLYQGRWDDDQSEWGNRPPQIDMDITDWRP